MLTFLMVCAAFWLGRLDYSHKLEIAEKKFFALEEYCARVGIRK
jgi:hypothetical protein